MELKSLEALSLLFHSALEKIFEGFIGGEGQFLLGPQAWGEVVRSFGKHRKKLVQQKQVWKWEEPSRGCRPGWVHGS